MPRKVRPRFAIDPVEVVPPCPLAETDIKEILITLPCLRVERAEARARLQDCSATYLWLKRQYQVRPTAAARNAYLAQLGRSARDVLKLLQNADMESEFQILSHPAVGLEALQALKDLLDRLDQSAQETQREGTTHRGPQLEIPVHRTVQFLADFWLDATGQPFTHNPKDRTEYKGEPRSPAGYFVMAFFRAVDRDVTPTKIVGAMASVVRGRRRGRRSKSSLP